jgi:serine protease Do
MKAPDQAAQSSGINVKSRTMFSILFAALASVATAAWAMPAKVKQVEEKAVVAFPEGGQGRSSYLRTIKSRFDTPNSKIGELQRGWECGSSEDILWGPKTYNLFGARLNKVFRAEQVKARYPIPVVSDAIFDEPGKPKADASLHVGMLIKEIAANFCQKSDAVTGGVYMKIFWQLYSPEAQKVIFEATTEGSYQPESAEKSMDVFYDKAFAATVRNLLAEQGFYAAIANPDLARPKGPDTLKLRGAKGSGEALAKNITTLRSAVVTVSGDVGSGSGFFVSQEGYLLTNQHVVGNAKFVKVKLPTGRELVGEVVRLDRIRDVALIKTEPSGVPPMALRSNEPNIGEEVYVLGSPLGDRFNTTLTRGILSGYRTFDDKRYLQSDVAILPGNSGGPLMDGKGSVIGITVSGLGAKGLAGMNFFIPIGDALTKLGVELN